MVVLDIPSNCDMLSYKYTVVKPMMNFWSTAYWDFLFGQIPVDDSRKVEV